jgi:hypothetical protein
MHASPERRPADPRYAFKAFYDKVRDKGFVLYPGKLTQVETPDQITPEQANSPTGAAALRSSALGNFANYFAGDNAGGGVGMNIAQGLLGDEMLSARGGTEHLDSRAVNEAVFPATVWSTFGQANTQIIRAINAVKQYAPDGTTKTSQVAQLYMLEGFTYVIIAEGYCNGIPVGNADDLNPKTDILTNARSSTTRRSPTSTRLTTAAATDTKVRNARSWEGEGAGEPQALLGCRAPRPVTTDYVYNVEFSATTIINDVYDWMFATPNWAVRQGRRCQPRLRRRRTRASRSMRRKPGPVRMGRRSF